MRYRSTQRNIVWTVLFAALTALFLTACSDSNNVTGPPEPVPPGPLAIETSTLPSGSLRIFYDVTLSASGGAPPYSWSLSSGSLPNGLNLNSSGRISGTPATIQTVSPTFRLRDSAVPTAATVTKQLPMSITAVPQPTIITPSPLPNGIVGLPYPSTTLTAVGGTPPYTWSEIVAPLLPAGLTFNAATATISGIPSATETNVTHTFSVTDSFSPTPQTVSKGLVLTVSAAPLPLAITTGSPLPSGTVTHGYGPVQLAATGGTPPLTWDLAPGSPALPNGLQLSAGGVLSGTPSTAVNVSPVFRVRDAATSPQQTATKQLAISIVLPGPPKIKTSSLPNGLFNQSYNQTLQVSGGIAPFTWGVISGGLPTGLTLNSSTGQISGTATATGTFNFTVRVTDAIPQFDTQTLSIVITAPPAPSITAPGSLPTGTVNAPYPATTLTATGGAPPLTFQPVGLPFGLTFTAATATISGTPLSSGKQDVTFTVNDFTLPFNQTGTRTYPLTVNAALTIDTTSLPSGCTHQSYSAPLSVSGGIPPYTWTTTTTPALPAGLTITPAPSPSNTATLAGTPTGADSQNHTFTVKDSTTNPAATKSLLLTINDTLAVTTNSPLPSGQQNTAYTPVTLTACGGTPPYTWSTTVTPPLPDGLSIDTAGTISGTPTVSETDVSHTFSVQDSSANPAATKALNLTIAR